jgi:hypothetical protein
MRKLRFLFLVLLAGPAYGASITVGTGGNGSITSSRGGSGTITIATGSASGGAGSGWTDLGTVVSHQFKTATDPYEVLVGTTVEVDNIIVCSVATDNDGNGTDTDDFSGNPSDTNANTWIVIGENEIDPGAASAGAAVLLFYSRITSELTAGTTISVNLVASRTAKAAVCREFDISGSTASIVGTEQKEDAAGADPGALTVGSLANSEHVCFRGIATEMDATETTTETSGWTAIQDGTTGSTNTGNQRAYLEFLIATATSFTSDPDASVDAADRASTMNCLDQSP